MIWKNYFPSLIPWQKSLHKIYFSYFCHSLINRGLCLKMKLSVEI